MEVVEVVQEHGEVFELLEGVPLLLLDPLLQPLQDVVSPRYRGRCSGARCGEVKHGYDGGSLRELCELYLDDFGLKVQNCLNSSSPARKGAAGCWCPCPASGATSCHCGYPPAFAPANYFKL